MAILSAEIIDTGDKRDELGRRIVPRERRAELVRAYQASGLTQAAFARREGVRYSTFAHWVQVALKMSATIKRPVQFAEVRLPLPRAAEESRAAGLEVRLPDGTMLRGGSAAELVKLVRALRT